MQRRRAARHRWAAIWALGVAMLLGQAASVGDARAAASDGSPTEPKSVFNTLEDINGPSGKTFQGAVGIAHFEATASANLPTRGYGLAVDDMVVEWAEVRQVTDTTSCTTNGQCATVDLSTVNFFEGNSLVTVTVLDSTPYGDPAAGPFVNCNVTPANAVCVNDCNDDGDLTDSGIDDKDCNNNGINDVIVKATSEVEPVGELVALDLTATPGTYRGELPISAGYDSSGVLFIARQGTEAPTVTASYEDNEDGTGNKCRNDVDPAAQGLVRASTSVFFDTGAGITVVNAVLVEVGTNGVNHDGDGFADAGETMDMQLTLRNGGELPVTGLVARLAINDPKIDCILQTFVSVGTLPSRVNTLTTQAFRFKVSDMANRVGVNDNYAATFTVTMSSDSFDGLAVPQPVTLDLDLDASGGSGPTTFVESFDGGGGSLGAFQNDNIDFGLHSLTASDGYRCQYSNPDWNNSNSYGTAVAPLCYLGATAAHADATWWHPEIAPALGTRGYTGMHSAHYGIDLSAAQGFTTPMRTLDAIKTTNPVNLGTTANSELSFKYQVSLVDDRVVAPFHRTGDRAVVMVQLADAAGDPSGNWIKLFPYVNVYDTQSADVYANCFFDPIDDGTDEDDYFDPTDPVRRLGPSSTCFPEFVYAYQGDTQEPFGQNRIARASEGPGLQGATGVGTWVEGRYDLSRFRGRRLRLRYLTSAYWGDTDETHQARWNINDAGPAPEDDGWWIDDVRVSNTLTSAATLSTDNDTITPIGCGNSCNTITPHLATDPFSGTLVAPGQVVELDASGSSADRCLNGALQFRFCISSDNDCGDAGDSILRGFSDNPVILDAPTANTHYAVDVRCSTATSCLGSAAVDVVVNCPGGSLGGDIHMCGTGAGACGLGSKNGILRENSVPVDWLQADFSDATSIGSYSGASFRGPTSANPLDNSADGNPSGRCATDACTPGAGFYYLAKKDGALTQVGFCNSITWQDHLTGGSPGRDAAFGDPSP